MLVLTRKLMERLYIGEEICVTVVRLEGGQVRLGIDAPRHIRVVRGELAPLGLCPTPGEPGSAKVAAHTIKAPRNGFHERDAPPHDRSR